MTSELASQLFLAGDFCAASSLLQSMEHETFQAAFLVLCQYYAWQTPVRDLIKTLEETISPSDVSMSSSADGPILRCAPSVNAARLAVILVRASSLGCKPSGDDISFLHHFLRSPLLSYEPKNTSVMTPVHSDAPLVETQSSTTKHHSSSSAHGLLPSGVSSPARDVMFGASYLRIITLLLLSNYEDALILVCDGRKWEEVDIHELPALMLECAAVAFQGLGDVTNAVNANSIAISKALRNGQRGGFPCHLYATRVALCIQMKKWKAAQSDCEQIEEYANANASSSELFLDPLFLFRRSFLLEHYGQLQAAIAAVTEAVQRSPPVALFFIRRARLLERVQRVEDAIGDYSQAIVLNDTHTSVALNNRGVLYVKLSKYEFAMQDYDAAISLDANFVDAYANRSLLHRLMNNWEAAIQDVSSAIDLDSANVEWRKQRAELLMEQSRYELAIEDWNRAIEEVSIQKLNGPVRNLYERRAVVYDGLGKPEAAASDREAAQNLFSCESCSVFDTCKFLKPEEF
eukprot:ANDGO_07299.mRNA.1 DnaJ homolog subfamily C member 7 homolog